MHKYTQNSLIYSCDRFKAFDQGPQRIHQPSSEATWTVNPDTDRRRVSICDLVAVPPVMHLVISDSTTQVSQKVFPTTHKGNKWYRWKQCPSMKSWGGDLGIFRWELLSNIRIEDVSWSTQPIRHQSFSTVPSQRITRFTMPLTQPHHGVLTAHVLKFGPHLFLGFLQMTI